MQKQYCTAYLTMIPCDFDVTSCNVMLLCVLYSSCSFSILCFLLYLHQSKPQLVITRCQGDRRNYVLRLFVKPARIRNQSLRSTEEYFALICQIHGSQEAINLCVTLKIFLHKLINHFYLHKKPLNVDSIQLMHN